MSELKPCPFCGKPGRLIHNTDSDYESQWDFSVECSSWLDGGSCVMDGHFKTAEEAIAAWNRRADDERRCETCESFGSSLGTPDCSELFSLIEGFGVGDASFSPPPDFYCAYWTKKEESDGSD